MIYKESGTYSIAPYLSKQEYKKALKSFVKYCVDMIIVDENGNFHLAKRKKGLAGEGFWFIGGQIPAFSTLEEARKRIVKRELGITVPNKNFVHMGTIRSWFNKNLPQDALSEVFLIQLKIKDIQRVQLDKNEYENNSLEEFNLAKIRKIKKTQVRKIFLDLWKKSH